MYEDDDVMADAEAELGCEPGELAGTFPPSFLRQAGLVPQDDDA